MAGLSQGRSQYDVIGASEGPDIGSLAPDSQSFLLRALATHLDKISAVVLANKDAPVEQVEYEVDASNLGAGGQQFHLPTGAPIVSYFLENNSTGALLLFAGASGAGRAINLVPGQFFKVALMPQQLTSLSITPATPTLTGLVRIVLTSAVLSPAMGSTIGAVSPAGTTANGSLSSASSSVIIPVSGYGGVAVTISGTWVGTIAFTLDDGLGTYTIPCSLTAPGGGGAPTTVTANGAWLASVAGHASLKIAFSAYTSGAAIVNYSLGAAAPFGPTLPIIAGIGSGTGAVGNMLWTSSFGLAYNGTSYDPTRKDSYTNGPQWASDGGASTALLVAATIASTGYVLKSGAGRIARAIVTTLGTAPTFFYDSTSLTATSGVPIGAIPANTPVGTTLPAFNFPAVNGIACPVQANASGSAVAFF